MFLISFIVVGYDTIIYEEWGILQEEQSKFYEEDGKLYRIEERLLDWKKRYNKLDGELDKEKDKLYAILFDVVEEKFIVYTKFKRNLTYGRIEGTHSLYKSS